MEKSNISLSNKELLGISGVNKIIGFDENHFRVDTVLGNILVKGSSLEMKNLHIENKKLEIKGIIESISYEDFKSQTSFVKKLFK